MKKILVTIIILVICNEIFSQILNPTCGNWTKTSWPSVDCNITESGDWVLVFSDEFDNNQIDRSKWYTLCDGWHREFGNQLQYYLDQNIILNNGILNLTAKKEPGYYDVWGWDDNGNGYITQKYFDYTSGWIETKMKFKYGLFEIRCKIPYGKGFWPAFWLYGYDNAADIGNEIDVFEFEGLEPANHTITLHKWSNNGVKDEMCTTTKDYGINFSSDFHIFSAEWDDFKIVYRVDGDIKRIDYKFFDMRPVGLYDCQHHVSGFYTINPLFPTKPANVILNLAISCQGCPFGGSPNSATVFPSALEIDYIRIYRRENPSRVISLCNFDYVNESSFITGKTITAGGSSCNSIINSDRFLSLFASEQINLLPGFYAENGCNFSAKTYNESIKKSSNNFTPTSLNNKSTTFENVTPIIEAFYKVYPNPNSGCFNVELIGCVSDFQRIEVIDINGKIIFQSCYFPNNIVSVDLSNNSKGIYFLKVTFKNKIATDKIIVQ